MNSTPMMPSREPQTILVVDDDALVREVTQALLEAAGHTVRVAGDGEEALRSLGTEAADIVLLDILMPKKEGLETLLELKRRWPDLAVIAMSASAVRQRNDFLLIAERFGADVILRKPFTPLALFEAIRGSGDRRAQQRDQHHG
jgi:CheY-like chemotaxis protein